MVVSQLSQKVTIIEQHDTDYCSVICGNIFGENDAFSIDDGNVVPSLIHKCFIAKNNETAMKVWGDGKPMREFIYSKDVAEVCLKILDKNIKLPSRLIVSGNKEIRIQQLVEMICDIFDYHNVEYIATRSNGNMKRTTNKALLKSILPSYKFTDLKSALRQTTEWQFRKT